MIMDLLKAAVLFELQWQIGVEQPAFCRYHELLQITVLLNDGCTVGLSCCTQ